MKNLQISLLTLLFIFEHGTIVQGQKHIFSNYSVESQLLFSISPNTAENVGIGKISTFYQANHKRLNAPMFHLSLNRKLFSAQNIQVDIKFGLGATFNELVFEKSKNFTFPTLGFGIQYLSPKSPLSFEVNVMKLFYTLDKEIYLQEKGDIGLGLNIGYQLPIFNQKLRFKVGYEYIKKNNFLNLDIFKFTTIDPDWKGIYSYSIYNNLISTTLEIDF